MENMKRILIIRLSAMGDAAMTAPVIEALHKKYPDVQITILTTPFFRPFFRNIPSAEFVEVDLKGRHKGFGGILRLWKDIRKQYRINEVADLHDVLRSKVLRTLFRLSGKRIAVIDKGRKGKKELTRAENKVFKPQKATIERYADVFRRLGYELTVPDKGVRSAVPVPAEIVALAGEKNGKWIGISPFAQHEGKRYPEALMEQVVEQLSRDENLTLFVFGGGPAEKAVAEKWAEKYPRTISIIGKIRLNGELDLMANLDTMISMDSSAMHMSSLVGVPVVSVWGATHPYAGFMGWGQSEANAMQMELPCRPCSVYGNKPCVYGDFRCLTQITPEQIVEKVRKVIL